MEHEVTNEVSDSGHLSMTATRAEAILATEHLDVVADKGCHDGGEVKACVEQGITPHIEKPLTSANAKLGLFTKEDFRYDALADCYWCPAGKALTYRFQTTELGREIKYYTTSGRLEPPSPREAQGDRRASVRDDEALDGSGLFPAPKEEIGWLKVVFGVLVAIDASLLGWLAQNYATAGRLLVLSRSGDRRSDLYSCAGEPIGVPLHRAIGGRLMVWVVIATLAIFVAGLILVVREAEQHGR